MNILQKEDGIEIENAHYIEAMELPNMDVAKDKKPDEVLDNSGQTEFRSAIGKLTSLAYSTRPDICFELKLLSTKLNNATRKDLQMSYKKILKVKSEIVSIKYPNLGKSQIDLQFQGKNYSHDLASLEVT